MDQIGRYRVVGELGRGAMGVVYRAEDPTIGRTVAIKTIHLGELTDASEREFMRERLLREARSAGILSHPGIVTIYDISEDGDTAYVFMEYVNGETLEKMAADAGAIDKDTIFDILRQTAAALDYAHGKRIVHRDIKPANIMISVDGEAKITDFGVAKILSQQMTQTRSVLGTPYYMSPEQIQGGKIDGRSDQFALGVISYELMTGERPYTAESLPTLLFKIVKEMPAPPNHVNPSLASEVGNVFARVFSKEVTERFPNCSAFVNALALAVSRKPDWLPLAPGDAGELETASPRSEAPAPAVTPATPAPLEREPATGATQISRPAPTLPPMPKVRDRGEHEVVEESNLPRNVLIVVFLIAVIVGGAYAYLEYFQQPPPNIQERASQQPDAAEPGEPPQQAELIVPEPPPDSGTSPDAGTAEAPAPETGAAGASTPEEVNVPPPPPPDAPVEHQAPPPVVERAPPPTPKPAPPPSPRHYWVQIRSRPAGARVAADDDPELICKTPCELPLTPGRHVLNFTLAGHRMAPRIIRVPDLTDVTANLDMISGTLAIRSSPGGAAIFINGEKRTEVTPALIKLPAGIYQIRLASPGRPDFNDTVEVKDQVITSFGVEW